MVQSWQGTANILKCFVAVTGAIHLSEVLVISLGCIILSWIILKFQFQIEPLIMQAEKDLTKLRHPGTGMGGYLGYQWGARSDKKGFVIESFLKTKFSGGTDQIPIPSPTN